MKSAKRIVAACLTATMAFQMLSPSSQALAAEIDAVSSFSAQVAANVSDEGKTAQGGAESGEGESSSAGAGVSGAESGSAGAAGGAESGAASGSSSSEAGAAGSGNDGAASSGEAAAGADAAAGEQQNEAAAFAKGAWKINTLADLNKALSTGDHGSATGSGDAASSIVVNDSLALLIVSNANPSIYQSAAITKGGTSSSDFDVTKPIDGYEFQGFGASDTPFQGTIDLGGKAVIIAKTFYNAVKLPADGASVKLIWKGTESIPIVAAQIEGGAQTLNADISIADPSGATVQDSTPGITGSLLGTVTGSLSLKASYSFLGTRKGLGISAAGNVGLLANTVAASSSLTVNGLSGLDGLAGTPKISSTDGGCAGGLVGCAESGATLALGAAAEGASENVVDVSKLTVTSNGGYAGGFAGKATNVNLSFGNGAKAKPAKTVGDAATQCAGGAFGYASFASTASIDPSWFDFGSDGVQLAATRRAGGLFGELDVANGDVTVQGGTYLSKLAAGADAPGDSKTRGCYGGIAGIVESTKATAGRNNALVVQRDSSNAASIKIERAGSLCYVGGIAGYLGNNSASTSNVAIVVDGAEVSLAGAAYAYTSNGKYGGAVGVVDRDNVLDVRDFKLSSDNEIGAQNGGSAGVAGSAWRGVIKFSGSTDLSSAKFAETDNAAQLVYQNYNSLIFAAGSGSNDGWKYFRSSEGKKIDDIHDYGEVIRLGGKLSANLVTVDQNAHTYALAAPLSAANGAYSISNADTFAKLAITWQTFGYFSMVDGIQGGSVASLASSTIEVTGTIDLAGTGLTGFTKDRDPSGTDSTYRAESGGEWESAHVFKGTLRGNGTISLAVGEPYGMRNGTELGSNDTSAGNGKIYRHSGLGLFTGVSGATITGVTIDGSIAFENGAAVNAGSLAGSIAGATSLSGATFKSSITYSSSFGGNIIRVGGIAGASSASEVNFESGTNAQSAITAQGTSNEETRVGGALGHVAGDTGNADGTAAVYNVKGLTIGGSITAEGSNSIAQIGGFIGSIGQGGDRAYKTVNITGLTYSGFSMNVGKCDNRKNGAGGLLGYSWGNALVNIGGAEGANAYALSVADGGASVTANSAAELGGLVYASSGHWVIDEKAIDLGNASFAASSADTFGLLVCRGGRIYSNTRYGSENYAGLYMEDRAYWGTQANPGAYKVEGIQVDAPKVAVFDEWVAKGRGFNSDGNEAKLIDGDWNAIVSLHTQGEKLDMSGNSASDNSYQNRSNFGKSHNTNANTRYYYNLDRALTVAKGTGKNYGSGTWLNTPEELLLMCACRYAPPQVKALIVPDGMKNCFEGSINIGSANGAVQDINLTGYSYYPTNYSNAFAVKNAKITFCYSKIKDEQANNKRNDQGTQHENMHSSLTRTLYSNLAVANATLAGTIGSVVNDADGSALGSKSGALVCRYIEGSSTNGTYKISIDGLTLDGLSVDGVSDSTEYAPLLTNGMRTYVSLDVKNVYCANYASGTKAATSLFGKLGGASADRVTATFNGIALPGKAGESIFTKATLLDSFGYGLTNSGSADYTFIKSEAEAGNVTYGKEIDSSGEYKGDQLWYYDEDLHGTDAGLVELDGKKANVDNPIFGGYLPYVRQGKSTAGNAQYHEIKVNQRVPNISKGCGTYGDPYSVTNASELGAIANYVNNKTALDGWEVTVTTDQTQLCKRRQDGENKQLEATYVYSRSAGKWVNKQNASDTLDADTMHRYLRSAYYSIEPSSESGTIEVDVQSFAGLGSRSNPFRGVIVGNLTGTGKNGKIVIKNGGSSDSSNSGTISGLIPYSYGSVVKDLDVEYSSGISAINDAANDSDGVPTAFFGGVIGCIMGGDNIIDGVTVSSSSFSVQATDSSISDAALALLSGTSDNSKLVPIGGYVGAIAGGGVIFRDMAGDSWRSSVKDSSDLYNNPYIGRVIDGYAFSEGCTVDNGNKNYKINELKSKGTACVETGDVTNKYYDGDKNPSKTAITTTVNNAQGLLVLSAIINSGAGAGAVYSTYHDGSFGSFNGSRAYAGRTSAASGKYKFGNDSYGKVRNASYSEVGKGTDAAGDFSTSQNDDLKAPGRQNASSHGPLDPMDGGETEDSVNSPYLVKNYATWQTGYVCASKSAGMDLQFANDTYDMTDYGTGFVGLSGRYYSNACASGFGADRDHIIPQVACINGNGAKIVFNSQVKQYVYDNYFLQSWGGLFNVVEYTNSYASGSVAANGGYVVKDLQLGDAGKKSNVSLTCIKADGSAVSYDEFKTSSSVATDNDTKIPHSGVGALAGMTANHDSLGDSGKYSNVAIVNCEVTGPSMAGGLLGNSGWASRRTDGTTNRIADYAPSSTYSSPVKLYNCRYESLTVNGASRVGGFVAAVGGNNGKDRRYSSVEVSVTKDSFTVAKNSTIKAYEAKPSSSTPLANCIAGGFVGLAWSPVSVNASSDGTIDSSCKAANVENVTVDNSYGVTNDSLSGTGGIAGNPKVGCVAAKLNIDSSGSSADKTSAYVGSLNSSSNVRYVGGVVGQIDSGSIAKFQDVSVKHVRVGTDRAGAALVGSLRGGRQITCDGVTVEGAYITGQWSGGIVGAISTNADDSGSNKSSVTVSNSSICSTTFTGSDTGGVAGDGRGIFRLSNLLFEENSFNGNQGVLVGIVGSGDVVKQFRGLYATGVDVKPKAGAATPSVIRSADGATTKAVNKKSFVAFGDYLDNFDEVDGSTLYSDDDSAVSAASPWVTTSPVSEIKVKGNSDASEKSLFGDGVAIDTAGTIKDDVAKAEAHQAVNGSYTYTNIGGCNDQGEYTNTNTYNALSSKSSFNSCNVKESSLKVDNDFPVLLISGNDADADTVKNYLNLVTNGGFSDAVRLNGDGGKPYVTATAEAFQLVASGDGGKSFVKVADPNDSASLAILNNGTSGMLFRASTKWDNEQSRFTLLTVTFNDGADHTYKVQVPIVVKRMLEIDFAATFTYGTNYKSSNYAELAEKNNHVLTSVGDAMTGYLTWTYNQAKGINTEYGWNTHLESGGFMRPLNKTIKFEGSGTSGTLPENTQLVLIDPANNSKEYTYTVPAGGASSVALSSFKDQSGTAYEEKWLSETMGVQVGAAGSGKWLDLGTDYAKITDKESIGAKVDGHYYRYDENMGTSAPHYGLSVPNENSQSESFYLVVRVPEGTNASVEGVLGTASDQSDVNTNINYVRRNDATQPDRRENTASTYSIASSYRQTLADNKKNVVQQMDGEKPNELNMSVTDTINPGENQYNSGDSLYFRLDSSLENYDKDRLTGVTGYPSGTSGSVSFYVQIGETYYVPSYDEGVGKWSWESKTDKTPAAVIEDWKADGNDMSFVLSDSNGRAIDLCDIREKAKTSSGYQPFTVRMEASLTMTGEACNKAIAASINDAQTGLTACTKPTYRAFLSPHAETLSSSSMTSDPAGEAVYYRKDIGSSTIGLMAPQKTQLGINVDDLDNKADGTIVLVGTYDLSKLSGAEEKLKRATTVTYTLRLQKKNENDAYEDVDGIDNYLAVSESDKLGTGRVSGDGNSIVFTDTRSEGGDFATRDSDSLALKHRFVAKVKTDNVESAGHPYANYRLVLTAHMEGNGVNDTPINAMDYGEGYENSDFVTYTLTKVKLEGIDH